MNVEEAKPDKFKDISIMTGKEKKLLTKRTKDEFDRGYSHMTIQEIRSKLKSPTHFMFIFGIECNIISKLSSTTPRIIYHGLI